VQQDHPEAAVEVWAKDEHRIGLHPVNRMVWVPRGEVPVAKVNWRFKWSWLVGFVHPQSGQTYWWTVPRLNSKVFSLLLEDFAEYFGLGQNKRVILTIDQAAFHTSGQVRVPEGIHILEMPPKSPELQPAERLWPLANEAIANRTFESLEQLEEVVAYRCRELVKQTDLIRDLTYYHWWPKVGS
jgi:transposase